MAYIGRDIEYGTFTKQVITPPDSSTTVYTLDQSVGNARNLIVSIGGVIQEPDVAFTATGTTLTFTSAPAQGSIVWLIYLGKEISHGGTRISSTSFQSENGNGSTTPFALTKSATNSASILVTLNGIVQVPDTDYTASNLVLTFTTAPDATHDIMVYHLDVAGKINTVADGSVTAAALAANGTMPAWNGSALTNLTAGNLTGTLPALDASNITSLTDSLSTETTSDPLLTSNPSSVGHMWLNTTTGELFCCTDNTTNNNVWKNIGEGSGNVSAPTNPTNTGTFTASETGGTTFTFQFSGGVVASHYLVDNITGGSLTVTTPEVTDGASHEFVTTLPGSGNDTVHTFRVRTKNAEGFYSSGITVSFTILVISYTVATGGDDIGTIDDYKYHVFRNTGLNFTVSQVGTDPDIEYMIVAGGGGAGSGNNCGGGGGGGGYLSGTFSSASATAYAVSVGVGGAGTTSHSQRGTNGGNSSIFGLISDGGGSGGGSGGAQSNWQGNNGGSGGGSGNHDGAHQFGIGSQGSNGGSGLGWYWGGGGGGYSSAGASINDSRGGNGVSNNIGTNNANLQGHSYYAAGGGGGRYGVSGQIPYGGSIGGGQGSIGSGLTPSPGSNGGQNGQENTGGGGGGGSYPAWNGGNGGKGIVIVKYKYQN